MHYRRLFSKFLPIFVMLLLKGFSCPKLRFFYNYENCIFIQPFLNKMKFVFFFLDDFNSAVVSKNLFVIHCC